jgi:hypothetical protein
MQLQPSSGVKDAKILNVKCVGELRGMDSRNSESNQWNSGKLPGGGTAHGNFEGEQSWLSESRLLRQRERSS